MCPLCIATGTIATVSEETKPTGAVAEPAVNVPSEAASGSGATSTASPTKPAKTARKKKRATHIDPDWNTPPLR